MKEITGLGWIVVIAFIFIVLLAFIWCCIKISDMYEDDDKR